MAILAGFYNSMNGDRLYNAEDMSKYYSGLISRGVLQNYKGKFAVTAVAGEMAVIIPTGRAYFSDGKYIENTADLRINIDPSDVVLNRIDRIVLRNDKSTSIRNASIIIKKGTPATAPVAPDLINNDLIEEMCIAEVTVNKLAEAITQANIKNTTPDSTLCGFVTGLIDQLDTTELFAQYEAEFNEWFNSVKDELTVVTLFREFNEIITTTKQNQTDIPINFTNYNPYLDMLEVYVNGLRLTKEEYVNNATYLTLALPLDIGQTVELILYKSVDGTNTESVVGNVEALQQDMAKIQHYIYYATGTDDNKKLSQIVQDFYNATGQFANVGEYEQLKIEVVGTLGVNSAFSGAGTTDDPYVFFNFSRPAIYRKVTVDFAKASRIVATGLLNTNFIMADYAEIKNLQMTLTPYSTGETLAAIRGLDVTLDTITLDLTAKGTGIGFSGTGTVVNCYFVIKSMTSSAWGIIVGNGLLRVLSNKLYAYKKETTASAAGIYTAGASTACVLMATNNYIPLATVTGYTQVNSMQLTVGKHILVGNALLAAIVKADAATVQEAATLLL